MDFKETQAIYLQIVDLVCDHIVTGKWKAQERIPSVRELGVQLEVNPNTVMRAYDYLQAREIICNKRGVGFFVTEGASKQITESRREEFVGTELPDIFRRMSLLAIPIELVVVEYEKYKAGNNALILRFDNRNVKWKNGKCIMPMRIWRDTIVSVVRRQIRMD